MREAAILGTARISYDLTGAPERAQIDRIIDRLERDPNPDGSAIFGVPGAPALRLYDDGTWRLLCDVPDAATIALLSIAHALDLPE
jgi:hypothetical protein